MFFPVFILFQTLIIPLILLIKKEKTFAVPVKTISMDGLNTNGEWDDISSLYFTDAEGDDPTSYPGLDLKSIRLYQDDTYIYIYIDFYDGVPNASWTDGNGSYRVRVWPETFTFPLIEEFDINYDSNGSSWNIGSQYGPLTDTTVEVNKVIEIKTPKNVLEGRTYFYITFVDWGSGGNDEWVHDNFDYSVSYMAADSKNATRIVLSE